MTWLALGAVAYVLRRLWVLRKKWRASNEGLARIYRVPPHKRYEFYKELIGAIDSLVAILVTTGRSRETSENMVRAYFSRGYGFPHAIKTIELLLWTEGELKKGGGGPDSSVRIRNAEQGLERIQNKYVPACCAELRPTYA